MQWPKDEYIEQKEIEDDDLLEIVGDLCQFILDDIIHVDGDFHDQKSMVGHKKYCRHLRQSHGLKFGHW